MSQVAASRSTKKKKKKFLPLKFILEWWCRRLERCRVLCHGMPTQVSSRKPGNSLPAVCHRRQNPETAHRPSDAISIAKKKKKSFPLHPNIFFLKFVCFHYKNQAAAVRFPCRLCLLWKLQVPPMEFPLFFSLFFFLILSCSQPINVGPLCSETGRWYLCVPTRTLTEAIGKVSGVSIGTV